MSRGGSEVNVVVTGTGAYHNLQLFGSVEHLGIHLVRADDECVSILHSVQQLCLLRIFLEQSQLVAGSFHFFSDALDSCSCERLFCCY